MNDLRLWRSNLPPELNKTADKILKLRERTCADIIKIGQLLTDAKACLEHGEWGEWLRNEFAWSQDTAERFMNVSEIYGDADSATLRKLDTSALYELARPSTPQEARHAVEALIADGAAPSLTDIKRIIREAKPIPDEPKERPSVRQAALVDRFQIAINALMELSTKPSATFAGAMPADKLDVLSNFLKQIAAATRKAA